MYKKILLTSVFAIGVATAGHAETYPSDGYMQESKMYENAATYDNLGVYDGTVTATAEYEDILYQIAAGTYLPAGSEGVTESCPANSYCVGQSDVTYNATSPQGATSCPSDYPNSSAGASNQTQCYTTCTVANANIMHATAVSGNNYWGDGIDTCVATGCENGYHVQDVYEIVEQVPLIPVDYNTEADGYAYINANGGAGNNNLSDAGLTENNTWALHFDYGTVYGRASCQTIAGQGIQGAYSDLVDLNVGDMTIEEYETKMAGYIGAAKAAYLADYVEGKSYGDSQLRTDIVFFILGQNNSANFDTSSESGYCWCQMTGFYPADSDKMDIMGAPWVYSDYYGSYDEKCSTNCAKTCAEARFNQPGRSTARMATFGARVAFDAGTCRANEISITWTDVEPEDVAANNAGMCTYDGAIRTPVKAATKPGKTFKGWRFKKVN